MRSDSKKVLTLKKGQQPRVRKCSSNRSNHSLNNEKALLEGPDADDEQSDWPYNEKEKDSDNSDTEIAENSNSPVQFNVVPWWDDNDAAEIPVKSSAYFNKHLRNSNYEAMNREANEEEAKTNEFDDIFNGALDLLSPTSKNFFHTKVNKSMVN